MVATVRPQARPHTKRGMNFAKRTASSTRISKKIGWLNNNAGLVSEIRYSEVKDLLGSAGDAEALRVLEDVEEKGPAIRDPTAYVVASVTRNIGLRRGRGRMRTQRWAGGRGGGSRGDGGSTGDRGGNPREKLIARLRKRVEWLNAHGSLSQELDCAQIEEALANLRKPGEAFGILKSLEEEEPIVEDPTAWVLDAVQSCEVKEEEPVQDEEVKDEPEAAAEPEGLPVIKKNLKAKRSGMSRIDVGRVKQRIKWLNTNGNLASELEFSAIAQLLVDNGSRKSAMRILKELEENAATVRNPTAYVAQGLRQSGQEKTGARFMKSVRPAASPKAGLRSRIEWINQNAGLAAPLEYARVSDVLHEMGLEPEAADESLLRLEENAAEVRDPTGYVCAALLRLGKNSSREAVQDRHAVQGQASKSEVKLMKRIAWLNDNISLAQAIEYDRVAPALLDVDLPQAMEILKRLEEDSAKVRDPGGWIIVAARRKGAGEGVGLPTAPLEVTPRRRRREGPPPPPPPPPPPLPPPAPAPLPAAPRAHRAAVAPQARRVPVGTAAEHEVEVEMHLNWLNQNVCASNPLNVNSLVPLLTQLQTEQVLEILERFEDAAPEVRDPSAYIAKSALRLGAVDNAGRGPDRRPDNRAGMKRSASRAGLPAIANAAPPRPPRAPAVGAAGGAIGALQPQVAPFDGKVTYYGRADEDKLHKRITWLNNNVALAAELAFDRVAPELMKIQPAQAMEILKNLERRAAEVRVPNGFVVSEVRRLLPGDGPRRQRRGPRS